MIDASQEMMTLGLCNIFGSFVQALPSCGAFTRSSVASSSDVRTPLQGIFSGKYFATWPIQEKPAFYCLHLFIQLTHCNKLLINYAYLVLRGKAINKMFHFSIWWVVLKLQIPGNSSESDS